MKLNLSEKKNNEPEGKGSTIAREIKKTIENTKQVGKT